LVRFCHDAKENHESFVLEVTTATEKKNNKHNRIANHDHFFPTLSMDGADDYGYRVFYCRRLFQPRPCSTVPIKTDDTTGPTSAASSSAAITTPDDDMETNSVVVSCHQRE
jgi:hypothetical protein